MITNSLQSRSQTTKLDGNFRWRFSKLLLVSNAWSLAFGRSLFSGFGILILLPTSGKSIRILKDYNRELAKDRIEIEHVNRLLKIFKIFSEGYRNRRQGYSLRYNLLAVIYNYELSFSA